MTAVAASQTAWEAVSSSEIATAAIQNSPLVIETDAKTWGTGSTLLAGRHILVGFSQKQCSSGNETSTLGDKAGGSGEGTFTVEANAKSYNKYLPLLVVVEPLVWKENSWGGNFTYIYINGVKTIPIS